MNFQLSQTGVVILIVGIVSLIYSIDTFLTKKVKNYGMKGIPVYKLFFKNNKEYIAVSKFFAIWGIIMIVVAILIK